MNRRAGLFVTIAVLTATALFPAAALGSLRMNTAVAGVALGDSEHVVRAHLGAPTTVATEGRSRTWVFAARRLAVTFVRHRAVIVTTRNPRERTRSGIGMGSTLRALRRAVPRMRCGTSSGFRYCRTGSVKAGRRSTTFLLETGRVSAVTVARAVS